MLILDRSNTVISGSIALELVHPTGLTPRNLDLVCPNREADDVCTFLMTKNYNPIPDVPLYPLIIDDVPGRNCIESVRRLRHSEKGSIIHIIVSTSSSPLATVFSTHSTFVMNFVSANGIYSCYPSMTERNIGVRNVTDKIIEKKKPKFRVHSLLGSYPWTTIPTTTLKNPKCNPTHHFVVRRRPPHRPHPEGWTRPVRDPNSETSSTGSWSSDTMSTDSSYASSDDDTSRSVTQDPPRTATLGTEFTDIHAGPASTSTNPPLARFQREDYIPTLITPYSNVDIPRPSPVPFSDSSPPRLQSPSPPSSPNPNAARVIDYVSQYMGVRRSVALFVNIPPSLTLSLSLQSTNLNPRTTFD
ncbi:hypothetical protein DFP72DRAFT_1084375 [Ephemerocybe angulata]|uniref:Uncharacterized protein n=1 Tax=Ephemerocybe angulata TaxID=980116 RepID=A0A8H6H8M9_9AGAR|nr:hypothetical protein DFP72DRAFT_1084375 [Tulosesus angulatus]